MKRAARRCKAATEQVEWAKERTRWCLIWPRRVSVSVSSVVLDWTTHVSFPRKILRVFCGYFEHKRRVYFEGFGAEPLQTITAILLGSKWGGLLLRSALQDVLSEVVNPPTKLKVFVDNITACLEVRNKERPEIAETLLKTRKGEVKETRLKRSITMAKEGKNRPLRHSAIWKRSFRNAA